MLSFLRSLHSHFRNGIILICLLLGTLFLVACSDTSTETKDEINSITKNSSNSENVISESEQDHSLQVQSLQVQSLQIKSESDLAQDSLVSNNQSTSTITTDNDDKKISVESDWWSPGEDRQFPKELSYPNATGIASNYLEGDVFSTKDHPFFMAIGGNGRACVTCHQPSDGMSLKASTAKQRWQETNGTDPLFAAIDGSDCPHLPQEEAASHSLLIEHGLFRIFRPWPPLPVNGEVVEPEFDIEVIRDPTGCNTHPQYGLLSDSPMVSVYRRPRPATNLKFITAVGFPFEPKNGLPLPSDPLTGEMVSGNITADSRVWTLREQAIDALQTHMEYRGDIDEALLEEIIDFETRIFTAQSIDFRAGDLTGDDAKGGAKFLAQADAGVLNSGTRLPMWDEYDAWLEYLDKSFQDYQNEYTSKNNNSQPNLSKEQFEFRQSVARGVKFFRDVTFLVKDNAGITDMGFGNPVRNDCNFCHNMTRSGMDVAPGQVDLGTTNSPFADPAPHLPLFKLTCKKDFLTHAHLGKTVYTTDPGFALTTGRCKDIGKITIQNMRGLAARSPYFANGSAKTIRDIVDYYVRRYNMTMTEEQKQDLTNLMSVL